MPLVLPIQHQIAIFQQSSATATPIRFPLSQVSSKLSEHLPSVVLLYCHCTFMLSGVKDF